MIKPSVRVTRILANPTRYEYEAVDSRFGVLRFKSSRWQPEILCPACKGLGRVLVKQIRHYERPIDDYRLPFVIRLCPICHNLGQPIDLAAPGLVLELGTHDDRPLAAIMEAMENA
jgi:hypothetical protein